MFAWKEKRDTGTKIAKILSGHEETAGANRRAIGLVPVPKEREIHDVNKSNGLKHQKLLVSIEGNHQTCCLRVISPFHKSRAAIMVFRGRVIGCLYGNKRLGHQLFGADALERAVADLGHPDSLLDAYMLPEDLVLAAGALFHGNSLMFAPDLTAEQVFEASCENLMRSNMPGCIVVNNHQDMAVCMVYIFGGHIVGVYSFTEGWVETSYESGLKYLTQNRGGKVMASMLPCHNVDEVMQLSISLSGLADRPAEQFEGYERPKSIEELLLDCSVPENEQLRNALQTREMKKVQSTSGSHPLPNNAMVAVGGLSPLNMYAR
ncbi:MAG: hypothetical protein IT342_03860 [Candidatus Melainabacteria bacterium]|nr:hypothetical protein [Candidatus Melainabacteria bacterium]